MSIPDLSHLNRCLDCNQAISRVGSRKRCHTCQDIEYDRRKKEARRIKAMSKPEKGRVRNPKPTKSPEELFAEAIQREKRL